LVESSQKKGLFLETVSRETGGAFSVVRDRAEALKKPPFNVIVARAVAPLKTLLLWTCEVSDKKTHYVFLKGKSFQEEIEEAQKKISFKVSVYPSLTSEEGKILLLTHVSF
jgi:16S rRNA (guanine527-N7)-methyltransferase